MATNREYYRALRLLQQPGARIVMTCTKSYDKGRAFTIMPAGVSVSDGLARAILRRDDVKPFDPGLFPGRPQSWRMIPGA
jgi:hypothetical protein